MAPDRLGQVAVTLGVTRDRASQPGQHVERIQIVQAAQRLDDRLGELEHQQLAAGLEHALHRGQRGRLVGHVAQAKADRDAVKAGIGKWQPLGVGPDITDIGDQRAVGQAVATVLQHALVDVGQYDQARWSDLVGEPCGDIAGPAGNIERTLAGPQAGQ